MDTTHKNVYFLNQNNEKIPKSGVIYQQKINPRDLCYQCSKDVTDFLFGKLRIRDYIYKPWFYLKVNCYHIKSKLIRYLSIYWNKKK